MKYNLQKSLKRIGVCLSFFETKYTTIDAHSDSYTGFGLTKGIRTKENIEKLLEKIADELEKEREALMK